MFEAKFVQNGDSIDIAAGSNGIAAGEVVISGELVGVAKLDIPANTTGAVATTGVYDVVKAADAVFTVGAPVYFNTSDRNAVADSSGNTKIGIAVADAISGGATVKVRIG